MNEGVGYVEGKMREEEDRRGEEKRGEEEKIKDK